MKLPIAVLARHAIFLQRFLTATLPPVVPYNIDSGVKFYYFLKNALTFNINHKIYEFSNFLKVLFRKQRILKYPAE